MSLEWYNNFLEKVSDPPGWTTAQEQVRRSHSGSCSPPPRPAAAHPPILRSHHRRLFILALSAPQGAAGLRTATHGTLQLTVHLLWQTLIEPYTYLAAIPGKEFRSALTAAFNVWMHVAQDDLDIVKKVVGMLHTASLLSVSPLLPSRTPSHPAVLTGPPTSAMIDRMDDVEDDSHLRRGLPGTSEHSLRNEESAHQR